MISRAIKLIVALFASAIIPYAAASTFPIPLMVNTNGSVLAPTNFLPETFLQGSNIVLVITSSNVTISASVPTVGGTNFDSLYITNKIFSSTYTYTLATNVATGIVSFEWLTNVANSISLLTSNGCITQTITASNNIITYVNGASNGIVTQIMTASNNLAALFIANDTFTSNALRTITINGLTNKIENLNGSGTNLVLWSSSITSVPLIIQGITGIVTNLFEIKDTNGNVMASFKSNGVLRVPNGSASQTAISFTNQDNTGIYYDGNGPTFSISGTARAQVTSANGSGLQLIQSIPITWHSSVGGNTATRAIFGDLPGIITLRAAGNNFTANSMSNRIVGFAFLNGASTPVLTNAHFLELCYDQVFNVYRIGPNTNNTGVGLNATNQPLAICIGTNFYIVLQTNGSVTFPNGTNNFPSIGWSEDNDGTGTGFYRPRADNIGINCNGFEFMRFNTLGAHLGTSALFGGNGFVFDDVVMIRDIKSVWDFYNAATLTSSLSNRFFATQTGSITAAGGAMTNAEWLEIAATDSALGWFAIRSMAGSSNGTLRPLVLSAGGTNADVTITTNHSLMVQDGSTARPAIGWLADDDGSGTGFYRVNANQMTFSANGNASANLYSGGLNLVGPAQAIYWSTAASIGGAAILDINADGAGVMRMESTGNVGFTNRIPAARTGIFNTASPTNAEWMETGYDGALGQFFLRAQKGSSNGTARPLALSANGTNGHIVINTNGSVTIANSLTNTAYIHAPTNTAPVVDTSPSTSLNTWYTNLAQRSINYAKLAYSSSITDAVDVHVVVDENVDGSWDIDLPIGEPSNITGTWTNTITFMMGPNARYAISNISSGGATVTLLGLSRQSL